MWFVKTLVVEASDMTEADKLFTARLGGEENGVEMTAAQIEGEMNKSRLDRALNGGAQKHAEKMFNRKVA